MIRFPLIALLALSAATLSAQTNYWDFSYSSDSTSASGVFSTTVMSGQDIVTGITGTWDGVAITGLLAPMVYYNDNVFSPAAPYLDVNGISFQTADSHYVNIAYGGVPAGYLEFVGPAGTAEVDSVNSISLSVTPAPWEPSEVLTILAFVSLGLTRIKVARGAAPRHRSAKQLHNS